MLKKVIVLVLVFIFILPFVILFIKLQEFHKLTKEARPYVSYCRKKYEYTKVAPIYFIFGNDGCYEKMFQLLLPEILVYDVKYKEKALNINRVTDFYLLSDKIIADSDAILSWGIGEDIDFEKYISENFSVPIYAFDCGITDNEIKKYYNEINSTSINIQRECIGSDKYIGYNNKNKQTSSGKVHTFGQKLKELNLEDKKVSLKLGIPEVYRYIDDILKYKDNILSISMGANLYSPLFVSDLVEVANKLENRGFVLVSRHHTKNIEDMKKINIKYFNSMTDVRISLVYVNKNILDSYYMPLDQRNNILNLVNLPKFPMNTIDPIVVIYKKLRDLKYNLIH